VYASKEHARPPEDVVQHDFVMADRCRHLAPQVTDNNAMAELTNMAVDFERKAAEVESVQVDEVFEQSFLGFFSRIEDVSCSGV
jgi:hypothetical protein